MTQDQAPDFAVPEGFVQVAPKSGFINHAGRFFETWRDGRRVIATRIEPHHLNSGGVAHGGFLLTLADFALSWGTHEAGDVPPRTTLSLTMDFAAPARAGAWLEAEVEVLRAGRNIAFLNCVLSANGRRIGHASGVFRLVQKREADIAKHSDIS